GRRKKALPALERNSTGPLNAQIFRSIQANIEPSIQTQSATTSNQILSIDGNNQLLANQNGQTARLFFLYLKVNMKKKLKKKTNANLLAFQIISTNFLVQMNN
ncbi:hypothetical protein BpHYR1_002247, partial [Brachionus plicatilis]